MLELNLRKEDQRTDRPGFGDFMYRSIRIPAIARLTISYFNRLLGTGCVSCKKTGGRHRIVAHFENS